MATIAVIINDKSGGGLKAASALEIIKTFNQDVLIIPVNKFPTIDECVQEALRQGVTCIVAAGGDGTVSCIAGSIVKQNSDVKLGILPLGTFNHLAKDLNIPLDIQQAFEIIIKGNTKLVDIGKVNNTYFINNSSLGVYPQLVKEREILQQQGISKRTALFKAIIEVFKKHSSITIHFKVQGRKVHKKTPFVFIGNNKYQISGLTIGSRNELDQGTLCICMIRHVGRWRLVALTLKALWGSVQHEKDFNVIGLQECTIQSTKNVLLVSHDGEITPMHPPITFKIVPKALKIIVP
jgi:diacylglycerol kinase family enzyme